MMKIRLIPHVITAALLLLLSSCADFLTDGATRVAYELEQASAKLPAKNHARYVMQHLPKPRPEGCEGAYRLQLSADSLLGIWCFDSRSGAVTGSHTTTYHLRFVQVPRTWIVDKRSGEQTIITLERQTGRAVVVDVR